MCVCVYIYIYGVYTHIYIYIYIYIYIQSSVVMIHASWSPAWYCTFKVAITLPFFPLASGSLTHIKSSQLAYNIFIYTYIDICVYVCVYIYIYIHSNRSHYFTLFKPILSFVKNTCLLKQCTCLHIYMIHRCSMPSLITKNNNSQTAPKLFQRGVEDGNSPTLLNMSSWKP